MKPTSIRGAVITHVGDDNNLNTPAGLSRGFLNIARECLEDARILHNLSPSFEPALDVTDIPDEALLRLDTRGKYILTAHAKPAGVDPTHPRRPRAVKTRERLAAWVRRIGIDDPNVRPNHAWRHTFKQIAERHHISERISDETSDTRP